jgi:ABC-type transporter Mla subunit MlaD
LLSQVEVSNQRLASLKMQMPLLDAVQDKAEAVASLLDDVRAAYDLLAERQNAVEQVADKVTRLVKNLDARKPRAEQVA